MCGGHCLGSRVGTGFPGWVMDNVQYPTGVPLLMLTLQKETSGAGSQNAPASPRRPGLRDKGRQRKCQCKMQTWHKYFSIQPRDTAESSNFLSALWRNSEFPSQRVKRVCGAPQRYGWDLRHWSQISDHSSSRRRLCMMWASDYPILPTPHSVEYFPCKDAHPWLSMKEQESDKQQSWTWLQTLLYLPVGHKVKATASNLHSSLKFMLDRANKEVAAVLQC